MSEAVTARLAPGEAAAGAHAAMPRRSANVLTLAAGVYLVSLLPLLVTPVVPTIDFYNHVARYFILSHLDELGYLGESYAPAWKILPNLGLDVLALPVFELLPPLVAAKCIIALIFAVQFSGVLALNKALNGTISTVSVLLAGILLYSYILAWGFANFLLAGGLVFWGLALWFRLRSKPVAAALAGSLFAVLIFFCHGFAFAMYGVTLALLEFGAWLNSRPRRFGALVAGGAAIAVQAIVPAILFRMAPTSDAGRSAGEIIQGHSEPASLVGRIAEVLVHQGFAIVRVADSPSLWLDVLSFVAVGACLILAWRRGLVRVSAAAVPALLVLAVLSVLMPPSLFGVGKIADRVPLLASLLLAASLYQTTAGGWLRGWPEKALAALLLVRLAANAIGYAQYRSDFDDFAAVARLAPAHALIAEASPPPLRERDQDNMRCQMYGPLMVPLHGNPTPLFAIPSQQPMTMKGDLAARYGREVVGKTAVDDPLLSAEPQFDYYLACGYPSIPGERFAVIAERGRFRLLKAREAQAR